MRCYQHIGLTEKAKTFLNENVNIVPDIVCPKCDEVITAKMQKSEIRKLKLFHDDGPLEYEYVLKDGRICKEILQSALWSSGPMGFMCLEIDGEKIYTWSKDEMNKY